MFKLTKPEIWQKENLISHMLLPFSAVYFIYLRIRSKFVKTKKLDAKVICIGNAVVGGAGKTPTAIKIYEILRKVNPTAKIAFISKGYKGSALKPTLVNLHTHSAKDVGDEPLLLSKHASCFVGKDRKEVCEYAVSKGYTYLILDDGLHDKRIEHDLRFLVVDGGYGFGNFMPLPAGPLRDRIDYAAENIDAAVIIGKDLKNSQEFITRKLNSGFKLINAEFESRQSPSAEKYIAFAGIGRPQKFFDTLQKKQFNLVETRSFPDHYNYRRSDIEQLNKLSEEKQARLITTEKDAVKLPVEFTSQIEILSIKLKLNENEIISLLNKII